MIPDTTTYPPAPMPTGRTELDGAVMIHGPDGALLPVATVKPQHVMEDELVRSEIGHAIALSAQVGRFAAHVQENLGAFEALIAERYGATVGGKKGIKMGLLQVEAYHLGRLGIIFYQQYLEWGHGFRYRSVVTCKVVVRFRL